MTEDLFSDLDAKYGGRQTTIGEDPADDEQIALALAQTSPAHVGFEPEPGDDGPEPGTLEEPDVGAIAPVSTSYGTYNGPRLTVPLSICGWCSTRQCSPDPSGHGGCRVWMRSPGSDPDKRYNDHIPCKHPCTAEKVTYLRSIFGAKWKPDTPVPDTHVPVLRMTPASSSVTPVNRDKSPHTVLKEVAVSDTQTEDYTVLTEVKDSDAPEADAAPVDEPEAVEAEENADEPTEAADEAAPTEKPKRAPRTDLEPEVKRVTDDFVTGALTLGEGEHLTPHRIAKEIAARRGEAGKTPSTGAVASVLDRWEGYGFAVLNPKPKAFSDYTDEGREKGLSAMKAAAKEAKRSATGSGDVA